ncbi:MAG TPA: hypothetical protein VKB00_03880, partial [Candidatus Limnocylindrales bacterium]|nr:hypothetical protein [Candidatus Limnocylindrales bacterium]
GVSELRKLPGVVHAAPAAGDQVDGKGDRQTVEINLSLVDDAALGGVVGALGGLGAHILALRKSEPSLEDVFVELVGRGFDEAEDGDDHRQPPAADTTPDPRDTEHEPAEREEEEAVV